MSPTAETLAVTLGLRPHPEGGWFRETYRAEETVETARGARAAATAILFLVTSSSTEPSSIVWRATSSGSIRGGCLWSS